jgi:hypothetical protein
MTFKDEKATNSSHSSIIIPYVLELSFKSSLKFLLLSYRFDIDALDNCRSIGIQIDRTIKKNY